MKRIGIVTYHNADNLGAVLQAYALHTVLDEVCGIYAEVIDYRCDAVEATKYSKRGKGIKEQLKALIMNVYYLIKHIGFTRFRKRYLKKSRKVFTSQNIHTSLHDYDAFITGSDQVWNLECSGGDNTYFLEFVPENRKKYAYAASIGSYQFRENEVYHYSDLLARLDRISVREASAKVTLGQMGITDASVCPDPVMLLTRDRWLEIMPGCLCKQRYVLVYLILPDEEIVVKAEEYARKHKCKVISNKVSPEFIFHNSPGAFLSWVYYAECVFTNSFHGTAMSLIFDKPLAAKVETAEGCVNNRIKEILELTGAEKCIMAEGNDPKKAIENCKITKMRLTGVSFLQEICMEI